MIKTIITGYKNPDLDTYACIYAYSEFLNKKGENVVGVFDGNIHREAEFVLNKFDINRLHKLKNINDYDEVILVDTDNAPGIDDNKIIEVIDHRKVYDANRLKNLKRKQIELVGACATLIAEKFYKEKIKISSESAILLYSAIASNTVNFRGNITTNRDKKMFEWLSEFIKIDNNYIEEMFRAKSDLSGRQLSEILKEDWKILEVGNKKICIVQLEIVGINEFLNKNSIKIDNILKKYKENNKFDFVAFTIIDILKGYNIIIVIDNNSRQLVQDSLDLKFEKNIAKTNSILMRKEIIPKVKEYLERENH